LCVDFCNDCPGGVGDSTKSGIHRFTTVIHPAEDPFLSEDSAYGRHFCASERHPVFEGGVGLEAQVIQVECVVAIPPDQQGFTGYAREGPGANERVQIFVRIDIDQQDGDAAVMAVCTRDDRDDQVDVDVVRGGVVVQVGKDDFLCPGGLDNLAQVDRFLLTVVKRNRCDQLC